ncbi:MAG TPA: heparin lyase I family protein, partial [Thermoleophilaceae bacterium]
TNNASPSFTFSSTPSGGTFECRLDVGATQGSWTSCSSTQGYSSLAQGDYVLNVKATVGGVTDTSPATRSFTVDTTAPDTNITSGPSGTIATNTATFGFSSPDGTASFECKLDLTGSPAASYATCPGTTKSYTGLADGAYTFTVRAKDPATNVDASPSTQTFTVAAGGPPAYTVTFQDSFEGATFPQTQQTGAWNSGKLIDGNGGYFNQVTPSGFSAVDGTKIAESGLTTTSTRSEIQCHSESAPIKCAGGEGSEWVYEWSVRIPSTVTVPNQPHPRRPNIMQTKPRDAGCYGGGMVVWPSTDSTKFELRQNIRGGTITDPNGGCTMDVTDTVHLLGTFTKGDWHRVVFHAKWSTSATTGFQEMWIDGVKVMQKQTRPTMIVDPSGDAILFRLGIYNSINASNWNVQYDHVKIGTVP